jgi:hypothetical protein
MKKIRTSFIFVILGILLFTRCSNEVDLYADYKDITIVYGLLNASEDTSWIKITKAFSGPGNALVIAHNPDSSNYPYKLDATLNGQVNSNNLPPIHLDTITIYHKQEGDSIFYYPKQLMYYTTEPLNVNATYTLNIKNKGQTTSAVTPLIGNFTITYPFNTMDFMFDHDIKWNSVKNAKRYEVTTIFNYKEYLPGTYEDTLNLFINLNSIYTNPVRVSKDTEGGENMELPYKGENFFTELENKLEDIPNVQRWSGPVDVIISAGSEVLHYYIEINDAAANSILQELPNYTNVNNGTGLFGSRHSVVKSTKLSGATERTLVEDYNLGFKYKTK